MQSKWNVHKIYKNSKSRRMSTIVIRYSFIIFFFSSQFLPLLPYNNTHFPRLFHALLRWRRCRWLLMTSAASRNMEMKFKRRSLAAGRRLRDATKKHKKSYPEFFPFSISLLIRLMDFIHFFIFHSFVLLRKKKFIKSMEHEWASKCEGMEENIFC